jgi:hypothetical protein
MDNLINMFFTLLIIIILITFFRDMTYTKVIDKIKESNFN